MKLTVKAFVAVICGGLCLGVLQAETTILVTEPGNAGSRSPLDELADRYNSESEDVKIRVQKVASDQVERFLLTGQPHPGGDLVFVKGAGFGGASVLSELLEPLESPVLRQHVPAHLWHPGKIWVAFSKKYRHIYINKQKIQDESLSIPETFEDLGDPQWKGRLCLRHGDKEYNTSLVSYFLNKMGLKATTHMLNRWMANEPVFVRGDLSGVLENIHTGQCLVGIANSYYLGYFLKRKNLTLAETPLHAVIPQKESAAHVNFNALGLLKNSPNKQAALEFLEWTVGANPQAIYSSLSYTFPVNEDAKNSVYYPGFLDRAFDLDIRDDTSLNPEIVTEQTQEVQALMKRVGWKFKDEIPE